MTEGGLKYVDLNQSDMVMILGALLAVRNEIPSDLEQQPDDIQLKVAQLLHLIQRFKEALQVPDDVWSQFGSMFAALKEQNSSKKH